MAGTKVTALTAITTLEDADVFPVVDDPAGTPVTKKITALNIKNYVQSLLGSTGVSSSTIVNTSTSLAGVAVTASATPNTKGSYTELIASTAFAAETIVVNVVSTIASNGVATGTLLDLAVGGSGSEVDFISNLPIGFRGANQQYVVPIAVPAGSRISARIQGQVISQAATINVILRESGDHSSPASTAVTYGANTALSVGLNLTAAGTINTKSAYTELTSSTSADIVRMLVCLSGTSTSTATAATGLVDIATGAAASEVVIIPDIFYEVTAAEAWTPYGLTFPYTVSVPAGTRLSVRYQATSTATGARPNITVIGFA
jgi:hypothetical protein